MKEKTKSFTFTSGILLLILIFPAIQHSLAQENDKAFEFKGYLTNMQQVMFEDPNQDWILDNLIHNRLNFYWYGGVHFNGSLQLRNRLIYGETLSLVPGYADALGEDNGWMDLTYNLLSGNSYVINTVIDRIWLQYSTGGFVATAGRQRINWGQTFVWNPNDIFNAYSYFDFDYEERPGSDALRFQFYPNYTSSIELAAKIDSTGRLTAAGMYRFNIFSYDIQFIAGMLNESDYLAGFGWSGNLGGAGFRGEGSYFHPIQNDADTSGMFMASLGFDYTFPNTFMLQGEYLYSSNPFQSEMGFLQYYSGPVTVKQLAFTKHSLFVSASYQVTPLLNTSLAGMYFPALNGYFFGPNISFSILDNLDLGFYLQYFNSEAKDPQSGVIARQDLTLWFLRLKWSF